MNQLCMLVKDRVYGRDVRLASQTLEMISYCDATHEDQAINYDVRQSREHQLKTTCEQLNIVESL